MKILCKKAYSRVTGKDLGKESPWLTIGKEYIVLAINYGKRYGIDVYIQTEDYGDPSFINLSGFEILNQKIPSSWVTTTREFYDQRIVTILPSRWNYESFFEDVDDQKQEAIDLFIKETRLIYQEENDG